MNIGVIGTGYVGLVTGTCLSETGNNVLCMDIDQNKIQQLKNGKVTIFEPGLETFFKRNLKNKRLSFTTNIDELTQHADIIFLALPTPPGEDGSADLSYILKVAKDLSTRIKKYTIVINKSTVPVGTAQLVKNAIQAKCKVKFDVVSNPEFLREGVAIDDFMKPDRIIIGTDSPKAKEVLTKLYAPYVRQGNPILFMDTASSELTKYAANSFLATKISFMNEVALICEKFGANVDWVRKGMGLDERIGKRFLFPGLGYGGSCFPKDVLSLFTTSKKYKYDFKILDAVMQVNQLQREYFFNQIKQYFKSTLKGKSFFLWGLAFKPNTDDTREAPATFIIDQLLKAGAKVYAYDPEAMPHIEKKYGNKITLTTNMYEALNTIDALLIMTEWNEFRTPNWTVLDKQLKCKTIFDGRNIFDIDEMKQKKYYYQSIGREIVNNKKAK